MSFVIRGIVVVLASATAYALGWIIGASYERKRHTQAGDLCLETDQSELRYDAVDTKAQDFPR